MRVFYRSRVDDYYIDYIGLSEYWGCYIYIYIYWGFNLMYKQA